MRNNILTRFIRSESTGGILLMAAMVLALIAENSTARSLYDSLLETIVEFRIGDFELKKPLLLWINDGLMAVFFFYVGLELKREILAGRLKDPRQVVLPLVAALGGILMPVLFYSAINWNDPVAMKGWAIPAATDIAFALGVLSLLGNRVPAVLKLFLLTLAIVDDLGAILIIAVFYTGNLSIGSLLIGGIILIILLIMNLTGIKRIAPYLLLGVILWVAVLKSGVHATLAGVALAFFIPLRVKGSHISPLRELENDLHSFVSFVVLPVFAFANSGISLFELNLDALIQPVTLGIALGLILGKQIGVFGLSLLAIRMGFAKKPPEVNWKALYGVSVLSGIGFTMSLFISSLAWDDAGAQIGVGDRLGILIGSIISALWGYSILRRSLRTAQEEEK